MGRSSQGNVRREGPQPRAQQLSTPLEAGEPSDIVGHKTLRNERGDLYHEPLRRDEAQAIIEACDAARDKRARDMPTEQDAINALWAAQRRLQELGWREAIYCPKDGSSFDAIEPGSTGIFRTHYSGTWPEGGWWSEDGGDLWPSRPILYRQTAEERQRWAALRARLQGEREASAQGAAPKAQPREEHPSDTAGREALAQGDGEAK